MAANDPDAPKDALSRYVEAAMGLTELTRQGAENVVRTLARQADGGNPRDLVENLLERSHENREALQVLIRSEIKRVMRAMGVATTHDVERLEQQLRALRRELTEERAEDADAAPTGSSEERST